MRANSNKKLYEQLVLTANNGLNSCLLVLNMRLNETDTQWREYKE